MLAPVLPLPYIWGRPPEEKQHVAPVPRPGTPTLPGPLPAFASAPSLACSHSGAGIRDANTLDPEIPVLEEAACSQELA